MLNTDSDNQFFLLVMIFPLSRFVHASLPRAAPLACLTSQHERYKEHKSRESYALHFCSIPEVLYFFAGCLIAFSILFITNHLSISFVI